MRWIARSCLMLIFLCGISTGKSQDILQKADSLFKVGEFEQSGLTYEWILYTESYPEDIDRAILGRVGSYKQLHLYDKAIDYIDRVNTVELSDSLRAALMYESLLLNYLAGNYHEVQSRLLMSKHLLQETSYFNDARLLLCLSQLKAGDWKNASISSESYIYGIAPIEKAESLVTEFHSVFDTLQAPKLKKPRTARILSMIVPGSGQAYAGYPLDGFISFGLHVISLGGAGLAFTQGLYITGWLGGFGVLQKLYFGGNHRAANLAEQKNRLNKENFIQPASSFLISVSQKYRD